MSEYKSIFLVRKLDVPNHPDVGTVVQDVVRWMTLYNIPLIEDESDINTNTLVVAIGGDGTAIHAAKLAVGTGAAVIGFNLGKVGFLADFPVQKVHETLSCVFAGELMTDIRELVKVSWDGGSAIALNDVVISPEMSDVTMSYDMLIDKVYAGTHQANGVITCTTTGSTAYALSVGGSIMMPGCADILQVLPIAAQTLTSRPIIVPGTPGITVKVSNARSRAFTIKVDGVNVLTWCAPENAPPKIIDICTYDKTIRLIHHNSWNHFDILKQKLGWGATR